VDVQREVNCEFPNDFDRTYRRRCQPPAISDPSGMSRAASHWVVHNLDMVTERNGRVTRHSTILPPSVGDPKQQICYQPLAAPCLNGFSKTLAPASGLPRYYKLSIAWPVPKEAGR
jgi:hypothetical protein